MHNEQDVLLKVEHLKQYFKLGTSLLKAVDDVSFEIKKGEVFGLVGESGCGKTTIGRAIIKLYEPTGGNVWFNGQRISAGVEGVHKIEKVERENSRTYIQQLSAKLKEDIRLHPDEKATLEAKTQQMIAAEKARLNNYVKELREQVATARADAKSSNAAYRSQQKALIEQEHAQAIQALNAQLSHVSGSDMEGIRAKIADEETAYQSRLAAAAKDTIMSKMQMIFQDPIASINPRMTVREIIAEGLVIRGIKDKKYIDRKVFEMLDLVGLVPEHADRYPHEFSGGQRQRIGIARAIVMEPDLIIADEPISALDVSIQAQVINLMNDLRKRMGLTILFIAHNLSVVKYFSDRIAVMHFGKIVEMATSDELFKHPLHPYTKSLLSAIPYPDPHYEKRRKRVTYVPAKEHDYTVDKPSMREIAPGHFVHCNDAEYAQYIRELK